MSRGVALLLTHPQHADLDCRDCQQWIYDIETCKKKTRFGKPQRRLPGQPTPCQDCPKGSPEEWAEVRPTDRTIQTLNLYRRNRATFGRALNDDESRDEFLQEMFARLDSVFEEIQHARQRQHLGELFAATAR